MWGAGLTPKNAFVFPGLLPIAGRGGKTASLSVSLIFPLASLPLLASVSFFFFFYIFKTVFSL